MKNWREYIKIKFGNTDEFRIQDLYGEFVEISAVKSGSNTRIEFTFIDEEDLEDVHFWGSNELKCGNWMSHFTTEKQFEPDVSYGKQFLDMTNEKYYPSTLPFKRNMIKRLEEEWLYIPLETGWDEKAVIVGNKLYRSELRVRRGYYSQRPLIYHPFGTLNIIDRMKRIMGLGVRLENYHFRPLIEKKSA